MQRTLIHSLPSCVGARVKIQGFVQTVRNQKRMQFIHLRDRSGIVQLLHAKGPELDMLAETISTVTPESAVTVVGIVLHNPQSKTESIEVQVESVVIEGRAAVPLPITKESTQELQLDYRWLSLRTTEQLLIFRIQTALEEGMRDYWRRERFMEIHSPKLMGAPSESGAELFKLEYFGRTATLAQSPQFYKQMAMAAGFDRVFEIGPVFRANNSNTRRHDTEFTSVDMEISWVDSHHEVMDIEQAWLRDALQAVATQYSEEIERVFKVKIVVPELPFPRITFEEAHRMLTEAGHPLPPDDDFDPEGERLLGDLVQKQFGHEFVFVTDWPINVRPFYHMRHANRPKATKSFDLLWKGLEITSGAQREHRPEILEQQIKEKGHDIEPLRDYVNFFRYGCPPHGGMGVGLTRLLMILLNQDSVRDVTFLYRGPRRLTP